MRPDPHTFAEEEGEHATAGGEVNNVNWAHDSDRWVFLDAAGMSSLGFKPEHLREIADAAEAATDGGDDTADDSPGQWDSDNDILLQNRSNTVGLAETVDALKPLSTDAQSVLLTPKLIREMLDVADALGEKDGVWLTVENGRPALATPKGDMRRMSAVVTPRFNHDDETPPAEDI